MKNFPTLSQDEIENFDSTMRIFSLKIYNNCYTDEGKYNSAQEWIENLKE